MSSLADEILRAQPLLARIELVLEAARRRRAPVRLIALSPADFDAFEAEAETSLRIGRSEDGRDYLGVRVQPSSADSYVETAAGRLGLFNSDVKSPGPRFWAGAASSAGPDGW